MPLVRHYALGLALLLAGCDGGTGTLALSWRFADQRGCAESGVTTVVVRGARAPAGGFACEAGLEPAAVELDGVARDGATLELEARSPQGSALYRGELALGALPAAATAILYAAAAR
jgi:hypothetical protein